MPIYLPPISRRKFLRGSLTAAALALGGCALPKGKRDEQSFALLSDIHIAANPNLVARHVNMTGNLKAVTAEVLAWPQLPGTMFINGDLAFNQGGDDDYAAVMGLIRPVREAGMPIHLGMGNHDNRERFWSVMKTDQTIPAKLPGRQAAIVRTDPANWFLLDSLIQTLTIPGRLGGAQLAWLTAALDANTDKPAIVMIHHQPERPGPNKKASGLEDTAELLAVLRPRSHVKAYIFGHTHHWSARQDESGIHLINLPPTAYVFDEGQPSGWVHATVHGDGARLELRCVDHAHKDHGQVVNLTWRTT